MHEPVEDRVGDRRVRKAGVPVGNGHLRGHQGRGPIVPVVQDLEQLLRVRPGEQVPEPVVEDQELDTRQTVEELRVRAIGMGQGDLMKESGRAFVAGVEVVTADGMRQRACQECLSGAGRAEDEDVEMLVDPLALGQLENEPAVQAPRGRQVEILDARL